MDEKCCQNDLWEEPVTIWWETNVYQVAMRTLLEWHMNDFVFLWNLVGIVKTNLVGIVAGDCKNKNVRTNMNWSTQAQECWFPLITGQVAAHIVRCSHLEHFWFITSAPPHLTNVTGIWKYVWIKTCNMSQAHAWGRFPIIFLSRSSINLWT